MILTFFYCGLSAALLLGAILIATRVWTWVLTTRFAYVAALAAFRPWLSAALFGLPLALVPVLLTVLIWPQSLGSRPVASSLWVVSLLWPWFTLLASLWTHRARSGLFRIRPDLLVFSGREGLAAYRAAPRLSKLSPEVWHRHIVNSTSSPHITGLEGRTLPTFEVTQHAHDPAGQATAQRRVKIDLSAARVLLVLGIGYVTVQALDALGQFQSGRRVIDRLPDGLVPVFVGACFVGSLAAIWAVRWKRRRRAGDRPTGASVREFPTLPEVYSGATVARSALDDNLPSLLSQFGARLGAREKSPVTSLLSKPLCMTHVELRTVGGVSTFRGTLVVDPESLASGEARCHQVAGAVLPRALDDGDFLLCVPSGLYESRTQDVGVESHAFNQRFSTVTNNPRVAQVLLNTRTIEWLLAMPDDICFIFVNRLVMALALVTRPAGLTPALESTAVAAVAFAPSFPLRSPRHLDPSGRTGRDAPSEA